MRGMKVQRTHHLMNCLEMYVLELFEWSEKTLDICEQFPLFPLKETLQIASDLGLRRSHTKDPKTRRPTVMTTSLLLTMGPAGPGETPRDVAQCVKWSADLENPRVIAKLEISASIGPAAK